MCVGKRVNFFLVLSLLFCIVETRAVGAIEGHNESASELETSSHLRRMLGTGQEIPTKKKKSSKGEKSEKKTTKAKKSSKGEKSEKKLTKEKSSKQKSSKEISSKQKSSDKKSKQKSSDKKKKKSSKKSKKTSTVSQLESVLVKDGQEDLEIQIFRLDLNGVTVELASLGASIMRFLVPSLSSDEKDDIVLGFESVNEMWESNNEVYFAVTPGRVTNRIKNGQFQTSKDGQVYQLEINNEPNHLHGGFKGFSRRVWDSEIVRTDNDDPAVRFTYTSVDGDQGYPGTVRASATYWLQASSSSKNTIQLYVDYDAELLDDKPSPVGLTQHSYFNLAGHDNSEGILEHTLQLFSDSYTPVDDTSIPTREVRRLKIDPVMDWQSDRLLRDALTAYGIDKVNLPLEQVNADLKDRSTPFTSGVYGFDHNYVVHTDGSDSSADGLSLVAKLSHAESGRRLTIRSDAPGVQLYTGNFLDGTVPVTPKANMKGGYYRWQGLCLETQVFPDSILVDSTEFPDFAKGQTPILTPHEPLYHQSIEFTLEYEV